MTNIMRSSAMVIHIIVFIFVAIFTIGVPDIVFEAIVLVSFVWAVALVIHTEVEASGTRMHRPSFHFPNIHRAILFVSTRTASHTAGSSLVLILCCGGRYSVPNLMQ